LVIAAAFAVSEKQAQDLFVRFQHEHSKFYATHEEFSVRYAVFKSNLDLADFYAQREEGSATYGVTKFMDLTPEEFTTYYKGALPVTELPVAAVAEKLPEVTLPTSFDWRDKNAVTPVYNQGQCGSCWAFSATETVESYHFLAGNSMISLSMQQVVDCDTTCYGCQGGWTYEAYQYLMSAGGQDTYNSYPYTAETGNCQFNPNNIGAKISGWQYVTQTKDETQMANYMYANGPLSICVDASSWQFYTSGVIKSCGDQIDHCVQATGFSTQSGTPAWNVRNSWGTDWGLQGYLYVERGNDVCGIAEVVTSVTSA
jgi:C1A family cysteine protease